jgi:peptide chain release factor 1
LAEENNRIVTKVLEKQKEHSHKDMTGVIIELKGDYGGQESTLFVSEMKECFQSFIRTKGFVVSNNDINTKTLKLRVTGSLAYNYLKYESGVHKVIRVPETKNKGRLHSSTIIILNLLNVPFNF